MAHELSNIKSGDLIKTIDANGLDKVLEPLIKEIHLFDTYIAGTTHLEDESALDAAKEGDKLKLMRENNRYDSNAIMVLTEDGKKLGYVPEKDNIVFARLMDAGKLLIAKIKSVKKHDSGYTKIDIGIYLVDF